MARPHNLQTRYTDEQVERALQLLALNGIATPVAEEMGIPVATLNWWRRECHAERYEQIRAEVVPQVQRRLAALHEDVAVEALNKQLEAMTDLDLSQIPNFQERTKAIKDMAIVAGVHSDKARTARDMPTSIAVTLDANQLVDQLARLTGQAMTPATDTTAEELNDPTELAVSSEPPS